MISAVTPVTAFGMTQTIEVWACHPWCQVSATELISRIAKGVHPEVAITEPSSKKHSRYRGVTWSKERQCWQAQLKVGKRLIQLGRFKTEVEAAEAYNKAATEHKGSDARLNRIKT